MQLVNLDTGEVLAEDVLLAHSFLKRLKGLMFTKTLPLGSCLHIIPCRSIHTFFMNYAIDVLHLDSNLRIVGIESSIQPGKVGATFPQTVSVIELSAGSIMQTKTEIGQAMEFKKKERLLC